MMAMIVDHSVVSDVTNVYSNNDKDFNENEHHMGNGESNVFKDASVCNDESICNQKHEESSRGNVHNSISSDGGNISCNWENKQSNEVLNNPTNNSYLDDESDPNKASKRIEVAADDKCIGAGDRNNSEKIPLKRSSTLVDSDSENETNIYKASNEELFTTDQSNHSGSSQCSQVNKTQYKRNPKIKSIKRIVDSESEDDEKTSNIYDSPQISHETTDIANDYQTLIDPESESETETVDLSVTFGNTNAMLETTDAKEKSAKKIKGSIRASKSEAMHKIHSESQRLLREARISLPYHKPKQRTLQEFLSRKKLSASLPKAPSTAAKLKMSSTMVSQILAEKEKEAEYFYKSSDSEDDTHEATSFACEDAKKFSVADKEKSATDITLVCAQDAHNVAKSNVDSPSKKEGIQCDMNLVAHKVLIENDSCKVDCQSDGHVLGLPLPKFTDNTSTDRETLSSKLAPNSKVTSIGSPSTIIDSTDDAKSNSKGLNSLLDRFFSKHVVNTNKQTDNESEVIVIQDTENGRIPVKDILLYKLPADNSELNKPGAKLMRLKEQLKLQMSVKRNEEWKQKEIELQTQEKEMWNEEEDYDLVEQEETTTNMSESTDSGDSEPEENDVRIEDKKRKKCLFADDEAEVTDNEHSDETDTDEAEHVKQFANFMDENKKKYAGNDKSDMEETEQEVEEEAEDKGVDEDENGVETEFIVKDNDRNINVVQNKKKRKRLIQRYHDGSENEDSQLESIMHAHTSKASSENNGWTSENESNMQRQAEVTTRSQMCKTPMTKTSMLDFVSPITQLSILNTSFDSNKKEHTIDKREFIFTENTQSDQSSPFARGIRNKAVSQKKLFYDIEESIDDEYLMQLCSTKFESTQRSGVDLKSLTSQSNTIKLRELGAESCNAESIDVKESESSVVEDKISGEKDLHDGSVRHTKEVEEVSATGSELRLRIVSSDDEEQSEEDTFLKRKKRSAKRLNLSDSEEEEAQSFDEENDSAHNEEAEVKYIDYDSEENEVTVVPRGDIRKVAADFLEEEAELSESDWDSADEDEKDLDRLDFEEADEEHMDEDEVKNQLEKIHMKQVLDEDKREVRLLKEMLFEDGDLHTDGGGRERKFKWRNIDKLGSDVETPQVLDENDGWVDVQEDEEEAKWNKLRHERDKFLEGRMKTLSNEDDLLDSQIFKFGLETLKKIKSSESQKPDVSPDKVVLAENTEPIMPRNITDLLYAPSTGKKSQAIYNVIKRRSLLTRGEESLARIATLAKQCDPASHTVNTRNFVFHYIDPCINNTSEEVETKEEGEKHRNLRNQPRKRKITSDLSSATKKKRK